MKYPKYIGAYTKCVIKLFCHDTGRWSLLPTFGVTSTSDNTCDWDDLAAYCRRVGLKRETIEAMARGESCPLFEPMGDGGFAPIGVTPPNAKQELNLWHEWYTPTMWITSEKYAEDEDAA